jgi:drug/metabolite transporter (DMT)-like permease
VTALVEPSEKQKLVIGIISSIVMIAVWSGFTVFSRLGVKTDLAPLDLVTLRFVLVGVIFTPFVYHWWPRHLSFAKAMTLAISGPAIIYCFFAYQGFVYAPAAYAGVFLNSMMPIFAALLGLALFGERFGPRALIGIALVICGGLFLGFFDVAATGDKVWLGALFFMVSSLALSTYVVLAKRWKLSPKQALVVISVPNMVFLIPMWMIGLPTSMEAASWGSIVFQAGFQGLCPGLAAVIAYAYMIEYLGSTPTAALSACVPSTATLLAIPVLGEWPTIYQWTGIAIVSLGLVFLLLLRRKPA